MSRKASLNAQNGKTWGRLVTTAGDLNKSKPKTGIRGYSGHRLRKLDKPQNPVFGWQEWNPIHITDTLAMLSESNFDNQRSRQPPFQVFSSSQYSSIRLSQFQFWITVWYLPGCKAHNEPGVLDFTVFVYIKMIRNERVEYTVQERLWMNFK